MIRQGCPFPPAQTPDLYILPLGNEALNYCFKLTSDLRKKGIRVEMDFSSKKIQQGLSVASKLQAKFCLIIGDQEIASGTAVLKNLMTREQVSIELATFVGELKSSSESSCKAPLSEHSDKPLTAEDMPKLISGQRTLDGFFRDLSR